MRTPTRLGLVAIGLACMIGSAGAADESAPHGSEANQPYPAAVSLLDEAPKGWTYRQSPGNSPLYLYDKDTANKSNCYGPCMAKWKVLEAPADAKPLGLWTIVKRRDGTHQWAYRTHPVYMLKEDSVQTPNGDGLDGVWHLLPHFQ